MKDSSVRAYRPSGPGGIAEAFETSGRGVSGRCRRLRGPFGTIAGAGQSVPKNRSFVRERRLQCSDPPAYRLSGRATRSAHGSRLRPLESIKWWVADDLDRQYIDLRIEDGYWMYFIYLPS